MIGYDDITVCMLHYNRPTILAKSLPTYLDFKKIFVWDNGSVPQNQMVLKALAAKNRNVSANWSSVNVGWPKAMNRMIINADTDWVLLTAEDMVLGKDFLPTLNKLLEWKPNLEQIYIHTFDAMLWHKKTIARFGFWEERQNPVSPVAEDDDWYLRLVEYLGYSPYVYPGDHIQGAEREKRLLYASTREKMEQMSNISYFSNCRWGISSINFDIKEITRDNAYITTYNKNTGPSGLEFHHKKWELTNNPNDLLNKDGTFWKRKLPEVDFYPSMTKYYKERYL